MMYERTQEMDISANLWCYKAR